MSITLLDYFLLLIYIPVLLFILLVIFNRKIKNVEGASFFFPIVISKLICGILVGFLFQYYYHSGDTFNYFESGKIIVHTLFQNPKDGLTMLFSGNYLGYKFPDMDLAETPKQFINYQIAAFFNLFSFNTYLVTSLFYSLFSFWGSWYFFKLIIKIYPNSVKLLGFSIFLVPSVLFWGSGILKDPICIGMFFFLFGAIINLVILKKQITLSILISVVSAYFIYMIKEYVLYAFLASLSFIFLKKFIGLIKSETFRTLFYFIFLIVIIVSFNLYGNYLNSQLIKVANDLFLEKAILYKTAVQDITTSDGSSYEIIGNLSDFNLNKLISIIPSAINVTFFRPYLWESKKIILLISSLESLSLLILTIYVIIKCGIINFFKQLFNDNFLLLMFLFSLIFAIAIGIATGNFGALSRYRIPCLPFYIIPLLIILNKKTKNQQNSTLLEK